VIEGPVAVREVVDAGVALDEVFVDAEMWAAAPADGALRAAVEAAASHGTPVWALPPGALARISDTVTPQGLLATAARRTASVAEVCARPGPVVVAVEVGDPGNLGTLARAAEAAGAAGIVVAGAGTDPFGPKAVRAGAGSLLRLPVVEIDDVAEALAAVAAEGREVVATVATGGLAPEQAPLTGAVAVLVGSEAHGLPAAAVADASTLVTIPLAAAVESLNVAVAGAVVLFEAARQRRAADTAGAPAAPPGTDWTTDPSTDRLGGR